MYVQKSFVLFVEHAHSLAQNRVFLAGMSGRKSQLASGRPIEAVDVEEWRHGVEESIAAAQSDAKEALRRIDALKAAVELSLTRVDPTETSGGSDRPATLIGAERIVEHISEQTFNLVHDLARSVREALRIGLERNRVEEAIAAKSAQETIEEELARLRSTVEAQHTQLIAFRTATVSLVEGMTQKLETVSTHLRTEFESRLSARHSEVSHRVEAIQGEFLKRSASEEAIRKQQSQLQEQLTRQQSRMALTLFQRQTTTGRRRLAFQCWFQFQRNRTQRKKLLAAAGIMALTSDRTILRLVFSGWTRAANQSLERRKRASLALRAFMNQRLTVNVQRCFSLWREWASPFKKGTWRYCSNLKRKALQKWTRACRASEAKKNRVLLRRKVVSSGRIEFIALVAAHMLLRKMLAKWCGWSNQRRRNAMLSENLRRSFRRGSLPRLWFRWKAKFHDARRRRDFSAINATLAQAETSVADVTATLALLESQQQEQFRTLGELAAWREQQHVEAEKQRTDSQRRRHSVMVDHAAALWHDGELKQLRHTLLSGIPSRTGFKSLTTVRGVSPGRKRVGSPASTESRFDAAVAVIDAIGALRGVIDIGGGAAGASHGWKATPSHGPNLSVDKSVFCASCDGKRGRIGACGDSASTIDAEHICRCRTSFIVLALAALQRWIICVEDLGPPPS